MLAHLSGRDSAIIPYMPLVSSKLFAPKRLYIVLGIFVVANVLITLKIATDKSYFNSSDFIAYSIGAKMLVDGQGQKLYDLEVQTAYWRKLPYWGNSGYILPYLAPPTTAVLYVPFLVLSPNMQVQTAMFLNFLTIFIGTLLVGKAAHNTLLSLLSVFSSWFVWVCIWQIQPTAILFLVTALLYVALVKKNYALAGVLCALYIIKPQYLLIAPLILVLTGKSRAFIRAFGSSILVLVTLNLAIVGPRALLVDYPHLLSVTDNPNYGNRWYEMYSIQQVTYRFSRLIIDSKVPALIAGVFFYLWGCSKVSRLADYKQIVDLFPLVILITTLSAYHVLPQDMSLVSIPVFLFALACISHNRADLAWKVLLLLPLGCVVVAGGLANYYAVVFIGVAWGISKNLFNRQEVLPTKRKPAQISL
jgi:hypothetical protein